jgi:hypothetical protein
LRRVSDQDPGALSSRVRLDRKIYRVAGPLAVLGAALLGAGTVLPWVTLGSKAHVQHDSFQLGPVVHGFGLGPVLIASAGVLFLAGGVTTFRLWRPNLVMPLLPSIVAGLVIANAWNQVFWSGAASSLDVGAVVCLIGIALGLASSIVMLPAEHPRSR